MLVPDISLVRAFFGCPELTVKKGSTGVSKYCRSFSLVPPVRYVISIIIKQGEERTPEWASGATGWGYNALDPMEDKTMNQNNVAKLKALCGVFGITFQSVADEVGVSRTYVSRLVNNDMVASADFWRRLEQALGSLVSKRRGQVFDLPAVAAEKIERLLKAG